MQASFSTKMTSLLVLLAFTVPVIPVAAQGVDDADGYVATYDIPDLIGSGAGVALAPEGDLTMTVNTWGPSGSGGYVPFDGTFAVALMADCGEFDGGNGDVVFGLVSECDSVSATGKVYGAKTQLGAGLYEVTFTQAQLGELSNDGNVINGMTAVHLFTVFNSGAQSSHFDVLTNQMGHEVADQNDMSVWNPIPLITGAGDSVANVLDTAALSQDYGFFADFDLGPEFVVEDDAVILQYGGQNVNIAVDIYTGTPGDSTSFTPGPASSPSTGWTGNFMTAYLVPDCGDGYEADALDILGCYNPDNDSGGHEPENRILRVGATGDGNGHFEFTFLAQDIQDIMQSSLFNETGGGFHLYVHNQGFSSSYSILVEELINAGEYALADQLDYSHWVPIFTQWAATEQGMISFDLTTSSDEAAKGPALEDFVNMDTSVPQVVMSGEGGGFMFHVTASASTGSGADGPFQLFAYTNPVGDEIGYFRLADGSDWISSENGGSATECRFACVAPTIGQVREVEFYPDLGFRSFNIGVVSGDAEVDVGDDTTADPLASLIHDISPRLDPYYADGALIFQVSHDDADGWVDQYGFVQANVLGYVVGALNPAGLETAGALPDRFDLDHPAYSKAPYTPVVFGFGGNGDSALSVEQALYVAPAGVSRAAALAGAGDSCSNILGGADITYTNFVFEPGPYVAGTGMATLPNIGDCLVDTGDYVIGWDFHSAGVSPGDTTGEVWNDGVGIVDGLVGVESADIRFERVVVDPITLDQITGLNPKLMNAANGQTIYDVDASALAGSLVAAPGVDLSTLVANDLTLITDVGHEVTISPTAHYESTGEPVDPAHLELCTFTDVTASGFFTGCVEDSDGSRLTVELTMDGNQGLNGPQDAAGDAECSGFVGINLIENGGLACVHPLRFLAGTTDASTGLKFWENDFVGTNTDYVSPDTNCPAECGTLVNGHERANSLEIDDIIDIEWRDYFIVNMDGVTAVANTLHQDLNQTTERYLVSGTITRASGRNITDDLTVFLQNSTELAGPAHGLGQLPGELLFWHPGGDGVATNAPDDSDLATPADTPLDPTNGLFAVDVNTTVDPTIGQFAFLTARTNIGAHNFLFNTEGAVDGEANAITPADCAIDNLLESTRTTDSMTFTRIDLAVNAVEDARNDAGGDGDVEHIEAGLDPNPVTQPGMPASGTASSMQRLDPAASTVWNNKADSVDLAVIADFALLPDGSSQGWKFNVGTGLTTLTAEVRQGDADEHAAPAGALTSSFASPTLTVDAPDASLGKDGSLRDGLVLLPTATTGSDTITAYATQIEAGDGVTPNNVCDEVPDLTSIEVCDLDFIWTQVLYHTDIADLDNGGYLELRATNVGQGIRADVRAVYEHAHGGYICSLPMNGCDAADKSGTFDLQSGEIADGLAASRVLFTLDEADSAGSGESGLTRNGGDTRVTVVRHDESSAVDLTTTHRKDLRHFIDDNSNATWGVGFTNELYWVSLEVAGEASATSAGVGTHVPIFADVAFNDGSLDDVLATEQGHVDIGGIGVPVEDTSCGTLGGTCGVHSVTSYDPGTVDVEIRGLQAQYTPAAVDGYGCVADDHPVIGACDISVIRATNSATVSVTFT